MRALFASIAALVVFAAIGSTQAANTSSNPGNCKVVEQDSKAGNTGATGMSTSVTAGGGSVSAHTTGAGKSVTVQSGSGTSSSVASAGASGQSTVVTGSGGDCTIIVPPGKKDDSK